MANNVFSTAIRLSDGEAMLVVAELARQPDSRDRPARRLRTVFCGDKRNSSTSKKVIRQPFGCGVQ